MNKTVCFTGHRPKDLYGYDKEKYFLLVGVLIDQVMDLYTKGYTKFITGGAQGVDQLAFWAVNRAKDKYPEIQNVVYIPFNGQERQWKEEGLFSQKEYRLMLNMADEFTYLQPTLTVKNEIVKALFARNHAMVDDADLVIGVYKKDDFITDLKGGTAECLKYALNKNKQILLINPFTFQKRNNIPIKK